VIWVGFCSLRKTRNQEPIDSDDLILYHLPIMDLCFTPTCKRFIKKQTSPFQLAIQDEVDEVRSSPEIGESKKGDLAGYRIHKFTLRKQLYLMAYRIQEDSILFCMIGTHENFYRDLKKYLMSEV